MDQINIGRRSAITISDSIIRDAPIRLTSEEWDIFKGYLVKKLSHVTVTNNGVQIDSTWVRDYIRGSQGV